MILVRVIKEITTLVEPLAEDDYAEKIRYDLKFKKKPSHFQKTWTCFSNVSLNNCVPNLNDFFHGVFQFFPRNH